MRDPQTEEFKVKLYKDNQGNLKGDGLCCYLKVSYVVKFLVVPCVTQEPGLRTIQNRMRKKTEISDCACVDRVGEVIVLLGKYVTRSRCYVSPVTEVLLLS